MRTSAHSATHSSGISQQRVLPARSNMLSAHRKPLAFSITQQSLAERSSAAFREFAGFGPDACKTVEQALECSPGTAKNLLEGRSTPSGIYDARAMAAIPGYFALKAELAGKEMALDPRHQERMAEFYRHCMIQAERFFADSDEPGS